MALCRVFSSPRALYSSSPYPPDAIISTITILVTGAAVEGDAHYSIIMLGSVATNTSVRDLPASLSAQSSSTLGPLSVPGPNVLDYAPVASDDI
jgi:hypothetical protein